MPSMDVRPKDADADWVPMPADDMKAAAAFLASLGDRPDQPPPPGSLRSDPKRVGRGREIVKSRCTTCHLFEGAGDDGGQGLAPELSGYGSVAWVRAQIANPATKATYREAALDEGSKDDAQEGHDKKGHMPRFDTELSPADIDLLAKWVTNAARESASATP
jgi:ubiquinol-cytochrome c reductase cytochrome b subunit